ncbi:MAG: ABC transporter ATP-binding protein [Ignavibacteriales bacterium]|nr:ABC transporter ATP-binding protein [Ignavibacteriales bacterium]
MADDLILQTRNLSKQYKQRWAVRNLDLEVYRGDVFGFLGPNGAGKSTTIRMLLSLIKPTTGDVELFGHSLRMHRDAALRSVGGIVEKPDFYLYLSAYKNLEIVGALNGGTDRKRILEVLGLVGLSQRAYDKVKTYSHGMKQRLGIAQSLLSDPELVILDEPTNGLDPQGMKEIRELIHHLSSDQKKTIMLSSHLLNEVEMVATRMAILNRGEMVVQGEVKKLLDEGEKYVVVEGQPKAKLLAVVKKQKFVKKVTEKSEAMELSMPFKDIPALVKALVKGGVAVHSVTPRRSLEDFFLSITENESKI